MNKSIKIILTKKLLEACGCKSDYCAYALLPEINDDYLHEVESHSLLSLTRPLELASTLFFPPEKAGRADHHLKDSDLKLKENFLSQLYEHKPLLGDKELEVSGDDKISIALSILFSSYLDCFVKPIQFYIPLSSSCAGQWDLWEKQDHFLFLENVMGNKQLKLTDRLSKHPVWKTKLKPEDFGLAVRKALIKRQMFDKGLEAEAMIKAIIIRMGELSSPAIRYETIDYVMRVMFVNLKVERYLRADREIEFLKRLENSIKEEILDDL